MLAFENIPDPEMTHFIWGMSKDFGIASFRFGVLHTWNKDLMTIMNGMCLYSSVQGHVQEIGAKMLSDDKWLNHTYFPTNWNRLKAAYEECKDFFESLGCQVRPSSAGLFAWIKLTPFLKQLTGDKEKELFLNLLNNHKIYMPNGTEFGCQDPGWFRIIFAVKRDHWAEFCQRFRRFAKLPTF